LYGFILQRYARQNHDSGGAKWFIAAPANAPARVLGFYTLSPASLDYSRTPAVAKKGPGRYDVPVFRLGRLAVDTSVQGRGLGGAFLLRAARRCMIVAREVGGVASASEFSAPKQLYLSEANHATLRSA